VGDVSLNVNFALSKPLLGVAAMLSRNLTNALFASQLLSAPCVSSIGQIIKSVCVSMSQSVRQSVNFGTPSYLGNGWS